ncbi:MAG TPA: M56 family metallopeptidase [Sedimentisphaerales bacterium]|nr:M56 family metallopeptidase [Sedimentisphaerales bacterium]
MYTLLENINSMGKAFIVFAFPMLIQSSGLIVILLLTDVLFLRKKVRAAYRYWLWMLSLTPFILAGLLPFPINCVYWLGDKITYAAAVADRLAAPLTWEAIMGLIWLGGTMSMTLLLLQRAICARKLVAQARNANNIMNSVLKYCRECIGVKTEVVLKVSAKVTSPVVYGLWRPVILVPHNLAPSLGSRHLRSVLLHELAHIKRGDLWANLIQTVLQIIYFYNPLLWVANSIIRRVRDQAVDERVVSAMGEKGRWYPETLVNLGKLKSNRPALNLRMVGVAESRSSLAERIKHINSRPTSSGTKVASLMLILVGVVTAFLLPAAEAAEKAPEAAGRHVDLYGDPLPAGAVARLGTFRLRHNGHAEAVAFSPDGATIASAGRDRTVIIWETATGKVRHRLVGHTNTINTLAFSGDGRMLASGSLMNGQVILWDPVKGKKLKELPRKYSIHSVAFSPDGKAVVSVSESGIQLTNVATGAEQISIKGGDMYWAVLTQDGKTIVSASRRDRNDSAVQLWNVATGKKVRSFQWNKIYSLALAPDGRRLALGNREGPIRVLDVVSGQIVADFPSPGDGVRWNAAMAFSPDSELLASVGSSNESRAARILCPKTGKETARYDGQQDGALSIAFSADGKMLAMGEWLGKITVLNAATGQELVKTTSHLSEVRSVAFKGQTNVITKSMDGTIRFWEAATGVQQSLLRAYWRCAISPDGRIMASATANNLIRLYDMAAGSVLGMLAGHESSVEHFAFSADSNTLASLDEGGTLYLWDVAAGKQLVKFESPVRAGIIVFSADGRTLASAMPAVDESWARQSLADNDFPICLWDTATGKEMAKLGAGKDPAGSLAFSPDGRLLASGHGYFNKRPRVGPGGRLIMPASSNAIVLWDAETGKQTASLKGHTEVVSSVAFSPDGALMASGSMDGTVRLWDVSARKEIAKLEGHGVPGLKGVEYGGVYSVAFSPDGKLLASGSRDGTALLWDVNEVTKSSRAAPANPSGKAIEPIAVKPKDRK